MATTAAAERRTAPRRPFQGQVELARPGDREAFDGDGLDLSINGMSIRSDQLPEIGSEIACRFALEGGLSVTARGEVVWADPEGDDMGQFGLRFTRLGTKSRAAIDHSVAAAAAEQDVEVPEEPVQAAPAPAAPSRNTDDERARMHIEGLPSPLRAKVRTAASDAIVVASDLSFLKLGQSVDVEHAGTRRTGTVEDVGIEIDDTTRVARLLITIQHAPVADATPARTAPSRKRATPAEGTAPIPLESRRTETPEAAPSQTQARGAVTSTAWDQDAAEAEEDSDTPPSWLVSTLAKVRAAGGAMTQRVRDMVVARQGAAEAVGEDARPSMRKQHTASAAADATSTFDADARRKRRYVIGAVAGTGALAVAGGIAMLVRQPPPAPPAPQVAVSATSESIGAAAPGEESAPTAAAPGTETAGLEPTSPLAAGAVPMIPGNAPGVPAVPALPADLAGAGTPPTALAPGEAMVPSEPAARPMPADLVAASRAPAITPLAANAPTRPMRMPTTTVRPATAAPRPLARAVAAAPAARPATTAPAGRSLGSAAVRTGTTLHLRMDGAIAGIQGGPAGGNTLVVRLPGRRSLDMASPLVRQDARIAGAGIFNRATGAELTLRFRDAVPPYAVRANGSTLEIVLGTAAAPARPGRTATAPVAQTRVARR